MRDEFEESKRARCIEVLGPLISLLDRCGSPTEFLVQIKQDLLAERDREAIQAYEAIQMPGMGGFLDLWLCKENGHTVRNAPQDNALLDHLILDLDHAIHHLDVYRRRRIRHPDSDPITPSVQALDRLLDPVAGAVHLRMVPYHLDRLHGPHPRGAKKGPEGLPFPFLEGVGPFDVVWRGGMSRSEIGPQGIYEEASRTGEGSWWWWHAYAKTPFGWVTHPRPRFHQDRLVALSLSPLGWRPIENFSAMEQWLRHELGEPMATLPRTGWRGRLIKWRSWFSFQPEMTWVFPWGRVHLFFEMREGDAVMEIRWDNPC